MSYLLIKNKIKDFFKSARVWYVLALVSWPMAGFYLGKAQGIDFSNPQIVIDSTEIDCGCENFGSGEEGGEAGAATGAEGEMKNQKQENAGLEIEAVEETGLGKEAEIGAAAKTEAAFVASKNGSKYYPIDCGSASRIKEENRVYYATEEEAQADGKERSSACKGLE